MKPTNKIVNYKIHWTTGGLIDNEVKSLLDNVLSNNANANYVFKINTISLNNCFNVVVSLEFTNLNLYNFFQETNKVTAKIARLLPSDSFIETVFTNNL